MSRLPAKTRDALRPNQQALHDHFNETVRRTVGQDPGNVDSSSHQDSRQAAIGGPFPFLAVLPTVGRISLDLLAGLQEAVKTLPADARETVSLVCASHFKATYVAQAHAKIATSASLLTEAQIDGIASGTKPRDLSVASGFAYDTSCHLLNVRGPLPSGLWDQCVGTFGTEGTAGLVH